MAGKKSSKKSAGTASKKPKKEKKGKKDKKSKVSKKASEKGSHAKLNAKDSVNSAKKVVPWSHEAQIQYRLSDSAWVEKGWTVLPMEKIIHKVITYKTLPSKPHLMLFKRRPKPVTKSYASGATLAVFKKNGLGNIYYPDGRVAVTRKQGRKCTRLIIFNPSKLKSSSELLIESSRGRSEPSMSPRNRSPSKQRVALPSKSPERRRVAGICAMFDSWGNGAIYDEAGNIRLNYTQREGILVDSPNGLPVKWKWPVKFTKGDSVENLGTHELIDDADKVLDDKDSDDEDENKEDANAENTEQKEKHGKVKKGSSKAKSLDKKESKAKKSGSGRKSSEVEKKGSKSKKKKGGSKSGHKLESESSSKQKKKRSVSGKDSDTTGTPKSGKQKKHKSAGDGEQVATSEGHKEPEAAENKPWPDIPEETCDQLTGKMADGRGDELDKTHSATNVSSANVKQQIAELHALRDKYVLPATAPLKPIVLKINDFVTFRVLDQSNISVEFHAQNKILRMELGFVVDPSEKIKVNKVDPTKWFVGKGVPCQIELFAKRSMNRYKTMLERQRDVGAKRIAERRQNEKRFGGPYLK